MLSKELYKDKAWLLNQYVEEKKTLEEIGLLCSRSPCTIMNWLNRFGVNRRNSGVQIGFKWSDDAKNLLSKSRKQINLDEEELYLLYIEQEISPYKIADIFGVSYSTVYKELKRYGISIRTRSDSKKGKRNPAYGKKMHPNTKKSLIKANIGRSCSEETKRRISEANSGENNGQWKGISFEVVCETCGMVFKRPAGKYNRRFCSMKCRDTSGSNNSAWKGGISFEPYCPKFNFKVKEKIRNRDHRVCRLCGKSEIENGERLSVHHIDGDKMQGCNEKNWYLVSLCRSCHVQSNDVENEFLIASNLSFT